MSREARHSSKSSTWQTPPVILDPGRIVLGGFDLDPASSARANRIVRARVFFTKRDDGLAQRWCVQRGRLTSIWLNPPGGWHDGKVGDSEVKRWWLKLLDERRAPYFGHALFLAFSIEAVQTTQIRCDFSLLDFPTVFFRSRIKFIEPSSGRTLPTDSGNTHASCLTYIPGRIDATASFVAAYRQLGIITKRRRR